MPEGAEFARLQHNGGRIALSGVQGPRVLEGFGEAEEEEKASWRNRPGESLYNVTTSLKMPLFRIRGRAFCFRGFRAPVAEAGATAWSRSSGGGQSL